MEEEAELEPDSHFQQQQHDTETSVAQEVTAQKRARRLGSEQVTALERAFEEDNRLGPERKYQLASSLQLEERQVAVWFQNRRARCKTKKLEKEYGTLRRKVEALQADVEALTTEKKHLEEQVLMLMNKVKEQDCKRATTISLPNALLVTSSDQKRTSPLRERHVEAIQGSALPLRAAQEKPSALIDHVRFTHGSAADESTASDQQSAIECVESSPATMGSDHHHTDRTQVIMQDLSSIVQQRNTTEFHDMYVIYDSRLISAKAEELLRRDDVGRDTGFLGMEWWDQAS